MMPRHVPRAALLSAQRYRSARQPAPRRPPDGPRSPALSSSSCAVCWVCRPLLLPRPRSARSATLAPKKPSPATPVGPFVPPAANPRPAAGKPASAAQPRSLTYPAAMSRRQCDPSPPPTNDAGDRALSEPQHGESHPSRRRYSNYVHSDCSKPSTQGCISKSKTSVEEGPRRSAYGKPPTTAAGRSAWLAWRAMPNHIAQAVEQIPQRMVSLRRVLGHQRQIRRNQPPFVVGHIRGVRLTIMGHPTSLDRVSEKVHNTL